MSANSKARSNYYFVKVWCGIKQSGELICAHCTCMAGLGEACSHVAAVLFTADANTKIKAGFSATSLPCSWLLKSFQFVPYVEVKDMDFRTLSVKRKLESRQKGEESTSTTAKQVFCASASTTQAMDNFFCRYVSCWRKTCCIVT